MSPLEKIQALTLCLDEAVRENRFVEIRPLLDARRSAIDEMLDTGQAIGEDRLVKLKELETDLMHKLTARRNAALERLNALKVGNQARRAYSARDF